MACLFDESYIGIAATDINELNPTDIYVFIPDISPMLTGIISTDTAPKEAVLLGLRQPVILDGMMVISHKSVAGGTSAPLKVQTSKCIKASYVGRSNMNTPNIVAGEQVLVYSQDDGDTFYWQELGRDNSKRTVEIVKIFCSATPVVQKILTELNTYFVEINTRLKTTRLHTSFINGELCGYDAIINGTTGTVTFTDTLGNSAILQSVAGVLNVTTKASVIVNTPAAIVNAPSITLNGNVTITGTLTTNKDAVFKAKMLVIDDVTMNKTLTVVSQITGSPVIGCPH